MLVFNKNMAAGLAGALVLNIIHQVMKKVDRKAPHIDEIGEEALSKTIEATGNEPPKGNKLFLATLGGDLLANATYFSLVGKGGDRYRLLMGVGLGAVAGLGALTLTKPLGLKDEPVNRSFKTQLMTVSWYVLGGLASALTLSLIKERAH